MKRTILTSIALILSVCLYSNIRDSLHQEIAKTQDTLRKIELLCYLSDYTANYEGDESWNYAVRAYELSKQYNDTCVRCQTYFTMGTSFQQKTQYTEALEMYQQAYQLSKICNNQRILHRSCNNLGMLNRLSDNDEKAMEWYQKSMQIGRENKDTMGMIFTLNNIGNIYNDKEEYSAAIEKYQESVDLIKTCGEKYNAYLSRILYNIAYTHYANGDNSEAIRIYKETYELIKDDNPFESAVLLKSIAEILMDDGDYKTALMYLDKAGGFYEIVDRKDSEQLYYLLRYQAELELGMHEAALKDLEKYQELQDSIDLQDMHVLITDIQEKYDNDELRHLNNIQNEALRTRNRTILGIGLISTLTLIILLFSLSISRYRKKTNNSLKDKQSQIDDALEYGRYVKEKLMMTDLNLLTESSIDHFIIDKPRDKVGGDFHLIRKHNTGLYILVGDATGHGIPGGFISISVLNLFHQVLESEKQLTPSLLLKRVIEKWNIQSNAEDQYDESFTASVLCIKDHECILSSYKQKSIFISEDFTTIPDKLNREERKESSISPDRIIPFGKESWIILSSDGYYDQLGEKDAGRLKMSKMISCLEFVKTKKAENLSLALTNLWNDHKGNCKQTDDILVVGIGLMSVKH